MSKLANTFINSPTAKKTQVPVFTQSAVLGVISDGYISKRIQDYSECEIPKKDRWTHVAAVVQDPYTREWTVIESHIDTGCARYPLSVWWKRNEGKRIFSFNYHRLEPHELIVYPREKIRYGTKSIIRMKLAADIGLKYGDDPDGVFCSELVSKCDGFSISKVLKLQPHEIKPVDFQRLALEEGYSITEY